MTNNDIDRWIAELRKPLTWIDTLPISFLCICAVALIWVVLKGL